MTLPEIPDEAVEAAWFVTELDRHDLPVVREALDAAWPFLYAAALHHAADELEGRTWVDSHDLRRMADEATPKEKP